MMKFAAVSSARLYETWPMLKPTSTLPNCRNGWPARSEKFVGSCRTASSVLSMPLRYMAFSVGTAMAKRSAPTFVRVFPTFGFVAFAATTMPAKKTLVWIPRCPRSKLK